MAILRISLILLFATPAFATEPAVIQFERPLGNKWVTAEAVYLAHYPDVAADPYYKDHPRKHYEKFGRREGRFFRRGTLIDHCDTAPPNNCIAFPEGARISGITWQSSVKTHHHEVLFSLVMTPKGDSILEPETVTIMQTHHVGDNPTMIVKEPEFKTPLIVPKGWKVWVYAIGWSPREHHSAGIEVQTTLWTE